MKKLVSLFAAGLVTLAMSFIGCSSESGGGRSVKTPEAPVIKAVTITNGVDTYTAGATKTPTLSVTVEKPTDGADLFYSWKYSKENADYVEFSNKKNAVFKLTEPGQYVVKVIVTAELGAESIETDSEDEDLILNITVLPNDNPELPDPVVPTVTLSKAADVLNKDVVDIELKANASTTDDGVLSYQWYNENGAISGATSNTYTTNVAGVFYVKVTNTLNGKTVSKDSESVKITKVNDDVDDPDNRVAKKPTINSISDDETVVKGAAVTLKVTASNNDEDGVLTYQWYKGDVAIAGETAATYKPDTSAVGTTTYKVVVTNTISGENVKTPTATNEKSATVIVTEPVVGPVVPEVEVTSDMTVTVGKSFTLEANVTNKAGDTVYTYQWYKAGAKINGATSETYTTSESAAATYNYSVTVIARKNGLTEESSKTVKVTVTSADVTVNKVEITTTQKTVDVGNQLTLTGKATMSDNTTVTTGIKFTSLDTEVAKIEGTTLTGLKAGIVQVTASYKDGKGNVIDSEPVTITVKASSDSSYGSGGITIDFN